MDQHEDRPSYEPETPLTDPTTTTARLGSFERLVKVFYAPGEVFEDIRRRPSWAIALLAYVVLVTATSLVVWRNIDFEASTREAVESIGFEVPEEALERQIETSERRWYLKPILTGAVFTPLLLVVAAALFYLMMKLAGSSIDFVATYSTMLHAYWPGKTLYSVLLAVLAQTQGPVTEMGLITLLRSSVAGFLPHGSSLALVTLTSFFDAFRIWGVILLVIGLAIVGRVSRGRAAFAALVPWILAILVATGLAALPSLFLK
ncbi:MAG: YIP1 family protein [Thermoanaerobaculales bacterium]|jgi:hypothetical protein|nr:YIP1 family protein [Thermoanaerobaculales bacterium]